ncbi:uncharacterized protein LOC123867293 [Maniola jurtina]|uniref:uncharacterized protein LOC123867293 n=1 Tax=Maniola jurtina TaxID=191418 RepID=UPI001E68A89E|nr:uncharacterized protein LOC123867293 [Maniola jurtina]XP_045765239.1 uncharacterized protein LOC123867293 [Maniola jurtina]
MDLVKTFAIISIVMTHIEMIPVSLTSSVELLDPTKIPTVLKLPKDIKPGTNITILGNNNNVGMFSATFSGDFMDKHDNCNIFFIPNQDKDQFTIKFENQAETSETTYDIDPNNKEVSFTLHVIARVTESGEIMDLYFEETDRGQEPIGHCRFASFQTLEYIVFKGVEHVQNLSFNFTRPDY